MADAEDRTLAASEKRLQQAREDGQVPLSREVVTAGVLAAAVLMLSVEGGPMLGRLAGQLQAMLAAQDTPGRALGEAGRAWLGSAGPLLGVVLLAGVAGVLLQTRFLLHGAALRPDLARLNPGRGLKRVFGTQNAVEAAKALAKLAVLAWAVWRLMVGLVPEAGPAMGWEAGRLSDRLGREMVHLGLVVVGAQAGIALLDVAWVRWRFAARMRMGREEQRQEQREADGDPRVKARLRQIRLARGRRRMMAAVPKATVVVTNPTHYAVALAYERGAQGAPKVVAKGMDEMAARIREAAREAGVPLVANPPLARALYAVKLDGEVPPEQFRAVAALIAYVWRLRDRARSA